MPAPRSTNMPARWPRKSASIWSTPSPRRLRRQFHRAAYRNARRPRRRRRGRAYPLRADVHFVDRAAHAAVVSAVPDAAMSIAARDPGDHDPSPDEDIAAHPHGSFFGRRKGHKLRSHQADLIERLLPRLALDITGPSPSASSTCSTRLPARSGSKSGSAAASI